MHLPKDQPAANVCKSSEDSKNWLDLWSKTCQSSTTPLCCVADAGCSGNKVATVGGHVWLKAEDGLFDMEHCYIAPLCSSHNNDKKYDYPKGFMLRKLSWLMQIVPHACYDDYKHPW